MTQQQTNRLVGNIAVCIITIVCAHFWPWETLAVCVQLVVIQTSRINEKTPEPTP